MNFKPGRADWLGGKTRPAAGCSSPGSDSTDGSAPKCTLAAATPRKSRTELLNGTKREKSPKLPLGWFPARRSAAALVRTQAHPCDWRPHPASPGIASSASVLQVTLLPNPDAAGVTFLDQLQQIGLGAKVGVDLLRVRFLSMFCSMPDKCPAPSIRGSRQEC